jgi:murein DD-endopeptidase MepM/ murein hydrolase activator NlpD
MLRASILATVALVAANAVADQCSRDWVCVEVEQSAGGVDIYARNKKSYPITVAVPPNAGGTREAVTVSVPGLSRQSVTRLPATSEREDSSDDYKYNWTIGWLNPDHDDGYLYRLPYADYVSFPVLQGFGSKFTHTGPEFFTVDFRMPEGTHVHAAREGVVAMVEERHDKGCQGIACAPFANYVVVLHDDGTTGEYYHLAQDGVLVRPGEWVSQGQLIGLSGNTGNSNVPHLHFGVYHAIDWGKTQSIAVQFATRGGVIARPRAGARYMSTASKVTLDRRQP